MWIYVRKSLAVNRRLAVEKKNIDSAVHCNQILIPCPCRWFGCCRVLQLMTAAACLVGSCFAKSGRNGKGNMYTVQSGGRYTFPK